MGSELLPGPYQSELSVPCCHKHFLARVTEFNVLQGLERAAHSPIRDGVTKLPQPLKDLHFANAAFISNAVSDTSFCSLVEQFRLLFEHTGHDA